MPMLSVCGLWLKESKSGKKYLTGLDIKAIQQLDPEKYKIMIFKNEKKKNEKEPDYSVMAAENDPKFQKKGTYMKPQESRPQPVSRPQANRGPSIPSSQPAWDNDDPGMDDF